MRTGVQYRQPGPVWVSRASASQDMGWHISSADANRFNASFWNIPTGMKWRVSRRTGKTLESRYQWIQAGHNRSFSGRHNSRAGMPVAHWSVSFFPSSREDMPMWLWQNCRLWCFLCGNIIIACLEQYDRAFSGTVNQVVLTVFALQPQMTCFFYSSLSTLA